MKHEHVFFSIFLLIFCSSIAWAEEKDAIVESDSPAVKAVKKELSPKLRDARDLSTKTFTGEALKVKEQVLTLFYASEKVNDKNEKMKARNLIDSAVDWDRIAKTCLGTAWNKQSSPDRTQFEQLLKSVILKTAFSRMDSFWDGASYRFDKIEINGKEAKVKTRFKVKDDTVVIEYYMDKKADKWLIHDVVYEDLAYSQVVNEKVVTFLRDSKFSSLLQNLKKRIEELDKDAAG